MNIHDVQDSAVYWLDFPGRGALQESCRAGDSQTEIKGK